MNEADTMKRAKMYIDKLANGINPLTDENIPESDILNNVRLSRCLFYVSDILRQVIEIGGVTPQKRVRIENFNISFEDVQKFEFSISPIPVSEIATRINKLINTDTMKKISHKHLTNWLVAIEMLSVETRSDGKTSKRPTQSGNELGNITEIRTGTYGEYTVVLYNRNAQQFIIDNIDSVIGMMYQK